MTADMARRLRVLPASSEARREQLLAPSAGISGGHGIVFDLACAETGSVSCSGGSCASPGRERAQTVDKGIATKCLRQHPPAAANDPWGEFENEDDERDDESSISGASNNTDGATKLRGLSNASWCGAAGGYHLPTASNLSSAEGGPPVMVSYSLLQDTGLF